MKRVFGSIWGSVMVLLLVLQANPTWAQNTTIDSLKIIVQTGQQDTTMVAALNALSLELIQTEELDVAKSYADQAITLAVQLNFKKGKAYALKNKGLAEYYQGHYKEVLEYWTQSLESFERAKDSIGIANLTNNLGAVYRDQGGYTKAIAYYLRSLQISENQGDTLRIATALMNIGSVYGDNGEYDKALENYDPSSPIVAAAASLSALPIPAVRGDLALKKTSLDQATLSMANSAANFHSSREEELS